MDHEIKIPEQYRATTKEVRTPFVRDAWQRVVSSLTHNDWLVHFEPKSEADKDKRAAGIAERWVKGATRSMSRDSKRDVPYEATKAMVRDAESVIKMVHRPDAWATFPQRQDEDAETYLKKTAEYKKGSPLPIAWRCPDRLQLVFEDGEWGDEWCIEYGEYPRPFLAQRYSMRYDDNAGRMVPSATDNVDYAGDRGERNVTPENTLGGEPAPEGRLRSSTGFSVKLEYFDNYHWAVVVDGAMAPGFPKENPYAPRLPYMRGKPDDEPEPVLYSMLFLAPALDSILTAWTNWMWLGMFPNPLLTPVPNTQSIQFQPPTGQDANDPPFVWGPGKMLKPPAGYSFGFMQPPPVGADAKEMVLILRGLIDIAGIPSVFRGIDPTGNSGYHANQMLAAVEMQYKRLATARARQLEEAVEFMCYLIPARIKQTVYILGQGESSRQWLALKAKGEVTANSAPIDRLGECEVTVRPDMAVMQQARAMIARQLTEGDVASKLDSRRHAMEHWLGYEDPDRIIDEIWVEDQMANNPVIMQAVVDNALQISGLMPQPSTIQQAPAPVIYGPDGQPLPPGIPGQVSGGMPAVPGINMPMAPGPPGGGAALPGGHPGGGVYPGQPPQSPIVGG